MSTQSWKISRRTCLQGLGVSLALPLLDGMVHGARRKQQRPKRLCCVYFPFGVAMPRDGSPDRQWGWFPTGEGADYELTNPLQPLKSLREQMTVLGGLSHPNRRHVSDRCPAGRQPVCQHGVDRPVRVRPHRRPDAVPFADALERRWCR